MGLRPGVERLNPGLALRLARGKPDLCALAGDLAFDVVDGANAIQRFAGDLRLAADPQVMEITAQMRPAGSLAELRDTIGIGRVELAISLVTIGLQNAARMPQMPEDMLFLPVGGELVGNAGRCWPGPGALVEEIGPDAPLTDTLAKIPADIEITQAAIQHSDGRIIGMQQIAGHDVALDPLD